MDYSLPTEGQDADTSPAQAYTPPPRMPGRRSGATVEISESGSVEYSNTGFSPARQAPASGPVTFSRNGSPVLGRDAAMSDVVDLGGDIGETSVGGALHNGWLTEAPNGGFVRAGDAQQAEAVQQAQPQDRPSDPDAPEGPARDNLPGNAEAILANLEARSGDAYRLLEASVIGGKMPSEQDLDAAGTSLGLDRDEVSSLVRATVNEFSAQAHAAVASQVGDSEAVFEWATNDPKGKALFEAARRAQATERSLDGYRQLSQAYILDLADKSPEIVAAGLVAGGTRAFVEGGRVMVDLGPGGTTTLPAAFNSGLASFGRKSRGSRK